MSMEYLFIGLAVWSLVMGVFTVHCFNEDD
mgnify:CR=1 FL=1